MFYVRTGAEARAIQSTSKRITVPEGFKVFTSFVYGSLIGYSFYKYDPIANLISTLWVDVSPVGMVP